MSNLDPSTDLGQLSGRTPIRMTNLPKIIFLLLGISFLMGIYYVSQNNKQSEDQQVEEEINARDISTDATAEPIFGSAPKGAIGGRPAAVSDVALPAVTNKPLSTGKTDNPITLQPAAVQVQKKPRELSEREKRRQQLIESVRQAKLTAFQSAVNSPSKISAGIGGGGSGGSSSNSSAASIQNNRSSQIQDLMAAAASGAMGGGLGGSDANGQSSKGSFLDSQSNKKVGYLEQTLNQPISPYELKAGSIIPSILLTGLNSDLPGQVMAQVSRDVYDTATGQYRLIPQGSKIIGEYDSSVSFGQNRALVAWNRLQFPDGRTIQLEGMAGADQEGYAGFKDKVDNHYIRVFGSAVLLSLIQAGTTYIVDKNEGSSGFGSDAQTAIAEQFAETGQTITEKNLEVQPTIKIRPGYRFNVVVNQDMVLPL